MYLLSCQVIVALSDSGLVVARLVTDVTGVLVTQNSVMTAGVFRVLSVQAAHLPQQLYFLTQCIKAQILKLDYCNELPSRLPQKQKVQAVHNAAARTVMKCKKKNVKNTTSSM